MTNRYLEIRGMLNTGTLIALGLLAAAGTVWARGRLKSDFRARSFVERGMEMVLFLCAGVAIATTAGIVLSLLWESLQFFRVVSARDFLTGTRWNAQTEAEFGALPLFFGTFMIALIAMIVAAPIGLFSAIFLSEYASPRARAGSSRSLKSSPVSRQSSMASLPCSSSRRVSANSRYGSTKA